MGRLIAVCLAVLAFACGHAAEALILIRHDRAGPNLRADAYIHPEWLLWPREAESGSENGLLSIGTALDCLGERADLSFASAGPMVWRSLNYRSLLRRGYIEHKIAYLGGDRLTLVANPRQAVGQEALLLGLGLGPLVRALPYKAHLPPKGLIVYEALGWNDARAIASRSGGRALAIEFPPEPGTRWTRFWRFGSGWPEEDVVPEVPALRVPGLIPIGSSLELPREPGRFRWVPDRSRTWGGPNRWLDRAAKVSPIVSVALYGFAVLAGLIGVIRTANEQRSVLDRVMVRAALLSIAADVLAGNLALLTGLDAWLALFIGAELGLLGLSAAISAVLRLRFPRIHPLFGICLVGSVVLTLCQPVWSDFSNAFRWPIRSVSPEAAAAWVGYVAGALAFVGASGAAGRMFRRIAGLALLGISCLSNPWWTNGEVSNLALAAIPLAASEGFCQWPFLATLALWPPSLARLLGGVIWSPEGLIRRAPDAGAFNTADWVRFLVSPALLATMMLVAAVGLFGTNFVAHRFRMLIREDPRRTSILWSAAAMAAYGLLQPAMLTGALILALAGALAILHDSVG